MIAAYTVLTVTLLIAAGVTLILGGSSLLLFERGARFAGFGSIAGGVFCLFLLLLVVM